MPADVLKTIRERCSCRELFDPARPVPEEDVAKILEAAQWAPTAHNMQNFELIVVDDRHSLEKIGQVRSAISSDFLHENYLQMSFSEEELMQKGTGVLASMFPPSWRRPYPISSSHDAMKQSFLGFAIRQAPLLLIATYDSTKRAPASAGDALGMMSLGCVMENIWPTVASLGLAMQILSVFSTDEVEAQLQEVLGMPARTKIAFACRIGYPLSETERYLRVRRELKSFVHHNRYGKRYKD